MGLRKLFIAFLILFAFKSQAQVLQYPTVYGYGYKRLGADTLFFLPSDTMSVPSWGLSKSMVARVGTALYYWNGTKWASLTSAGSDTTKVPYTGATQNVNLGQYGLKTEYVEFDTTTRAVADRTLTWSNADGTLSLGMTNGGSITQRIGLEQFARVKNVDATQINKGEVVYLFGASGDRASVKKADNRQDATSAKTLGVAVEDIAVNDVGFIGTFGVVEKLTLGSYTAGDILYVDSIPGQLTKTKPVAPYHTVFVGVVERANNGNGLLFVNPQNGYELDELHNVKITSPVDRSILVYDSTKSLWVDSTASAIGIGTVTSVATNTGTGITGGTITSTGTIAADTTVLSTRAWRQKGVDSVVSVLGSRVSGTTNYVSKFTGTNTIGNSQIFDNGTQVGIGIISPSNDLHIDKGNATASYLQFTAGTTTGQLATDGFEVGIDASGNGVINQQENLPMLFYTNNTERMRIAADGFVTFTSVNNTSSIRDLAGAANWSALYLDQVTPTLQNFTLGSQGTDTKLNANGGRLDFEISNSTKWSIITSTLTNTSSNNANVPFWIKTSSASGWGMIINASASQTQNLFELRNSSDATISAFFGDGSLALGTGVNSGYRLDVNGTSRLNGATTVSGSVNPTTKNAIGTYVNSTLNATANFDTLSAIDIDPTFNNGVHAAPTNNALRIRRGTVMIGAGAPSYQVDLNLGSVSSNTNIGYNVRADAGGNIGYSGYRFYLASSSGNVTSVLRNVRSSGTTFLGTEFSSESRDGIAFLTATSSPTERMRINASGNVGIGNTSPSYKLDVTGKIRGTDSAFFATSSGNVAIGNVAPAYKVDITGDIRTTTSAYFATTSGAVGIGTASPNSSAALQVSSTTKGFLPPVMSGSQAEAISTPAEGLLVYANSGNGVTITSTGWWGYNGSTWVKLN